jgi:membrane-associated protein
VKDNLSLVVIGIIIASIMPGVVEYLRHRRARSAEPQ